MYVIHSQRNVSLWCQNGNIHNCFLQVQTLPYTIPCGIRGLIRFWVIQNDSNASGSFINPNAQTNANLKTMTPKKRKHDEQASLYSQDSETKKWATKKALKRVSAQGLMLSAINVIGWCSPSRT